MYDINSCIHLHMHMRYIYICCIIHKSGLYTKGDVEINSFIIVKIKRRKGRNYITPLDFTYIMEN